ncbi:hypothetical protein C464_06175 [Halorubrum coriense DSM 10284]|uniref:Fibronectin type-III domain-containing protein n=1 Tax=Halorubrum coriense DSM 10284 TaxID=1227466 RepID=M0EMM1_9EURY|nr:hypothetical protein [Halorubrum coriense]ELZ48975.1 hypothetical protein C464_06175 [Halorubrum coriense DSM 10284]QRG24132.1 hypothetical protein HrrHm1_105 [Halorubrum virus Humcor1]
MPATFTTDLPDENQPVLGNGVEDEVAVDRESAVSNYGSVRIQIRETVATSWDSTAAGFGEFVGSFDTLSMEFVGREDGEQYEIRARTETEHVTGSWTTPAAITTQFPGATALSVTVIDETTVDLAWTDNADNEAGQLIVRERSLPDGSWGRQRAVFDAGPNTESAIDDTAQPGREYRYRIRPFTEHAEADSNTDTAVTPALDGIRDRHVPPRGWYVEIDHPDADEPLSPTVVEGAEWNPRLKAKPQVRIPVPRSSTWEDADVEGSTTRVWKDGTRLPIEELRTVERDETRDVLVAKGGMTLNDDIDGIEFPEEEAHVAAEQVIENELGWVANVDDPQTSAREDVRLFQASDSGDFADGAEGSGDPFPDTSPLTVQDNEVFAYKTGWFFEAETGDGSGSVNTTQGGEWSGGQSVYLSSGDGREFEFDLNYTIPEGEARVRIVYGVPSDPGPGLEFTLTQPDGTETLVESFGEGGLNQTGGQFELATFDVTLNDGVGDLTPGTYAVEVGQLLSSGADVYLDFVHVRDARFSYDLDDTTPVNGVVTGWQQRPASSEVVFSPVGSVEQVVAGRIDVEVDSDTGPEQLALRNDTTASWQTATNATSFETSFASPGQILQARVRLGREDSGSQSGQFGDEPQRLDFVDLFGDLVNTPVLLDFVHRGTAEEVLNRIADAGDFIWELRRAAPGADAEYRIEWTQPGQRVADIEPDLVSFEGARTIEGSYQRVIAEGKSYDVEGETFVTNEPGLNVGLEESPVDTGSETVYDVGDRSTQYEHNIDYLLDNSDGTIEILEGGSMSPDTEYAIDYEARFEGRYTQPAVDDPDTLRESVPDATSNRECQQVALAVVREVAAPLEEADVTVRKADPDQSLVASIPTEQLPFEGPMELRNINSNARKVSLTLGSRKAARDVFGEIRSGISAVSRNV